MQSSKPKTFSIVKFNMEIEFNNTKNCPVKDLLSLIRQDSIENLRQALLNVIDAANPNGEIYLYEQGYSLYESSDRSFSPTLLACRSKNEDCMKKAQEMQLSGDANSINITLPDQDGAYIIKVKAIDGAGNSKEVEVEITLDRSESTDSTSSTDSTDDSDTTVDSDTTDDGDDTSGGIPGYSMIWWSITLSIGILLMKVKKNRS